MKKSDVKLALDLRGRVTARAAAGGSSGAAAAALVYPGEDLLRRASRTVDGGNACTRGGCGVKVGTLYLFLPPGGSVEGATAALTTAAAAAAGGEEEVEVPVSVLAENRDRNMVEAFPEPGASGGRGLHLLAAAADLRAALEGRGAVAAEVSKLTVLLRGVREEEKEVEDGWILL